MTYVELLTAAKSLAHGLGAMLLHGTLLALLALLLVRVGRLRPAWQAAVWLVVLVKLVLPWGPALPFSLADVIASLRSSDPGPAISIPADPFSEPAQAPAGPSLAWVVLLSLWFSGTAFVLVRAIRAELAVRRAIRRAPEAPAEARALLAELSVRVGVATPRLVVGDAAVGPHVVGVFRPTISVPAALLSPDPARPDRQPWQEPAKPDPQLVRAALLHELAHIRRRDALARIVQIAAVALFWFWPFVRLASRRLERAREAACDAWALEACDVPRSAYARLLVRMARLQQAAAPGLSAPRTLDARVAALLGAPARARIGLAGALALIAWAALALGGARRASARGESCQYTLELAEQLMHAYPEADVDGDGVISQSEACDLQANLRRRRAEAPFERSRGTDGEEPFTRGEELLAEPLCCNCSEASSATCYEAGVVR